MTDLEQYAKILEAFYEQSAHTVLEGEALRAGAAALRELEAMEPKEADRAEFMRLIGEMPDVIAESDPLGVMTARAETAEKALGEAKQHIEMLKNAVRFAPETPYINGDDGERIITADNWAELERKLIEALKGGKG